MLTPIRRLRPGRAAAGAATLLVCLAFPASSFAQASRTWVSGVGDDVNPCSRTAPCKTFAGAISKTAPGGEIDALDPGGFGALTITKAITIDGGGGQIASVLVSGVNGIVIAAGPSDRVILRNLRINGIGTGINGVRFLSGARLDLENAFIFGFTTNGVDVEPSAADTRVNINDSTIEYNGGAGVYQHTTASGNPSRTTLINDRVDSNGCGISSGAATSSCSGGGSGTLNLISAYDTTIADNTNAGVLSAGPSGDVLLGADTITGNTVGLQTTGSPAGFIFSFGNNQVVGNVTDGTPNASVTTRARDLGQVLSIMRARTKALAKRRHHRARHHKPTKHHKTTNHKR